MTLAIPVAARAVLGALAAGTVVGGTTLVAAPPVFADPLPPNCTAADLAQVQTGVSAATSVYFFSHPDVNAFFTGLQGLPPDTVRAQIADYMAANPQVQIELSGIRQPMVDMRNRCGGSSDDES
jgi:hemophore-related protein